MTEGVEVDAGMALAVDMVERRPVLPALTIGERMLIENPRPHLTLPPRDQADRLHQIGEQQAARFRDLGALGGGEQPPQIRGDR